MVVPFSSLFVLAVLPCLQGAGPVEHGIDASSEALTTEKVVWTFPSSIGVPVVALGDRGNVVFNLTPSSSVRLAVLSSYDTHPPVPAWSIGSTPPLGLIEVACADEADVLVQSDITQTGPFSNIASLRKYSSGSSTPDWTFDFAPQGAFLIPVFDVSRDGQTIVGLVQDPTNQDYLFRVFGPTSGIPTSAFTLQLAEWGAVDLDLSADGSTLAFSPTDQGGTAPQRTYVVDVATQAVAAVLDGELPGVFGSQDGGGVSANGDFVTVVREGPSGIGHLVVHQRVAGSYQTALDIGVPPPVFPRSFAISEDGSSLAVGWWDPGDKSRVRVAAYDVATGAQTMGRILGTVTSLNNIPTGIAFSADGSRFVVGTWGDGTPATPELAVFSPHQNQPLATFGVAGSVLDVDFSHDGQRIVAGRLPQGKHANSGYTNTFTRLYDLGGQDVGLVGKPSVGAIVTLEVHGTPGTQALLLASPNLAPAPVPLPGVGTLFVDRIGLAITALGTVPPTGVLSTPWTLPTGQVGDTVFYQALTFPPAGLTADYLGVTLLP